MRSGVRGNRSSAASRQELAQDAEVFAALGDETRLRLVTRLGDGGPMSIVRLREGEAVTRQAITKHLHALESAGLVRSRRAGRECIWELQARRFEQARRALDSISRQWDAAIDRLRAFVEDEPDEE